MMHCRMPFANPGAAGAEENASCGGGARVQCTVKTTRSAGAQHGNWHIRGGGQSQDFPICLLATSKLLRASSEVVVLSTVCLSTPAASATSNGGTGAGALRVWVHQVGVCTEGLLTSRCQSRAAALTASARCFVLPRDAVQRRDVVEEGVRAACVARRSCGACGQLR